MNKFFKASILSLMALLFYNTSTAKTFVLEQMVPENQIYELVKSQINKYKYNNFRYYRYERCVIIVSDLGKEKGNELAKDLKKIKGIDNVIYIDKQNDDSFWKAMHDTNITGRVEIELLKNKQVYFGDAHVKTIDGGIVCVFTSIDKHADPQAIADTLQNIKNVKDVIFSYHRRAE